MPTKLEKLNESLAAAESAYDALDTELVEALSTRSLTAEELESRKAAEARVDQIREAITAAEADEARGREFAEARTDKLGGAEHRISIGDEARTYGPANPDNSFIRDQIAAARNVGGASLERLQRHQQEIEKLAAGSQSSGEARKARKAVQEARRGGMEGRAGSTGTGSLGDWLPPVYPLDEYAAWRTFGRTLIDQCRTLPLPETGMVISIPKVTQPTEAQNQTAGSSTQGNNENVTVSEQDMTGSYANGTVQTIVSNMNVSQQYLDRFGPAGYASDQLILADQQNQVNKLLDQFAWDQIIASIKASNNIISYTDSSFEAAKFKQAVHQAKAAIRKTDGSVTYPTHLITTADLWESVEGAYDSANRPLVVPQGVAFNPIAVGDESNAPEGYTGFRFASLPAFVDENFWTEWTVDSPATPTLETYQPTLVADLTQAVEWMEGEPVVRILPQPGAASLTVLIQTYTYCSLIVRYPGMLYAVAGSGTETSNLL